MKKVDGKVALVTGGASGIGAACSELLAAEGAAVMISDIDDARGEALAAAIGKAGGKAAYIHQDVALEETWPEVVAATEKRFGKMDVLVANAGIGIMIPALEMTLSDWRRQNAINLDGVFLSVKHGVPALRRAGGGSIVIMSSVAGLRGAAGLAGYSASKAGVRYFAKSVALECAAAGDKIRVNTVHPGIIDTPIWGKLPVGAINAARGANAPVDVQAMSALGVPMGRPGSAAEIAEGVVFLASDASRYMTGSELVIDGGMTSGNIPRRPQ